VNRLLCNSIVPILAAATRPQIAGLSPSRYAILDLPMLISNFEVVYLVCWVGLLILSIGLMLFDPSRYEICTRAYGAFLLQPWKLFTFFVALALITVVAPYSGDPTWDYLDSILISSLTFVVAPWSVGALFLSCRNRRFDKRLLVAACLFFTPCWFYDLYILLRDHSYPPTWVSNLFLSGPIVALAGLFWNLSWLRETGTHFAFSRSPWMGAEVTPFVKVLLPALVIAIPVVVMVLWFVIDAQSAAK